MRKIKLFLSLLMVMIVSVGNVWGAVVSGTTYNLKGNSLPTDWSGTNTWSATSATSYFLLTAAANYVQTDEFCQGGFTSIKVKARKYGGPASGQEVVTVSWVEKGGSAKALGTITPTSTTLTDYTISSPASVTGNKEGYIKITASSTAANGKGAGIQEVTINYTAGSCTAAEPHTVSFSTGDGNPAVSPITETSGGAGITLPAGPTPACSADGWSFAGWAAAAVGAETTTAPTLLSGTYHPTENCTLFAVYKRTEAGGGSTTKSMTSFEAISGNVENDVNVSYAAAQGTAGTAPAINNGEIRIYQNGGLLTITANNGSKLNSITIGSSMTTKVTYAVDGGSASENNDIAKNGTFTVDELDATEVVFTCTGTDKNSRLYLNNLSVTYGGGGTTYYLSAPCCCEKHAISIANNIENGSVSADLAEACEGTTVTLTFTPTTNYHLSAWTLNGAAQDVNANTFSMPAGAATISATFEQDDCDPLETPVVTVSGKAYPYDAIKLAWTAIEHADAYKVYIYDNEDNELEHNDAFAGVEYTIGQTLSASTTYKYSVQAISNTPATYCPSVAATGSFVTEALPTAHLTLIALGEEQQASGDYSILTPFALPSTAASCAKTFRGWDANSECASAPTYAKGAEFTFQNTTGVTLYAVYADETPGEATLTKMTSADALADGDKVVIVANGTQYGVYQETQSSSYVKNWELAASTPAISELGAKKIWNVTADNTNWKFGDATNGYLYTSGSNNLAVSTDNATSWSVTWNEDKNGFILKSTGGRYFACRTDLTGDNANLYRMSGTSIGTNGVYGMDIYKYATSASTYDNYSTTCVAAPTAEPASTSIAVAAAAANSTLGVTYNNVNLDGVSVALFNDAACTIPFDGEWLTATIEGDDKHIAYTIAENTAYAARTTYIKLTAPETSGAANPAVVVIPVEQEAKALVFASLAELVSANIATGTDVTVTFENEVITNDQWISGNTKRAGVFLTTEANNKAIEIFYNKGTTVVPTEWVVGGKLSATAKTFTWTDFSGQWELVPLGNEWTWDNGDLTYTAPKAVSSVVVSGAPTKTSYVDGEKFAPAGLTVTIYYSDETYEVNPVGGTFACTPERVAKGATSVEVVATFNEIDSDPFEVTGLTVGDIQLKTVAEFIAAGNADMRCYLEGIVSDIETGTKLKYGNFNLTDASGTIYVYGCLNQAGEAEHFADLDVHNGDKIKVIAEDYDYYNSKHEAKNVQFVSKKPVATMTFDPMEMEIDDVEMITPKTITEAEASAVGYSIKEGSDECVELNGAQITATATGTATIVATLTETTEYVGTTAEFTVTVTAPDTRHIANASAFEAISGDMTPTDIKFEAFKGDGTTTPVINSSNIRLYKPASGKSTGGYLTLTAKIGCTIDQVQIIFNGNSTAAYCKNDEALPTEAFITGQTELLTAAGLDAQSVSIVNLKDGSIDVKSIKVWYIGNPLPVDHYFLDGTYETTFEQNGTFDYTGLEVYASYDAGETITEPVEGFTVEADLSTAGEKKAEVYLNEVKIAEYDITVTAGKENPALAYNPASATITAGDAWSAPTLSNTFNVTPITYSSNKESVATVDENGVITLAGGYGTAVITAHFDETVAYIESEATYTITVNKPAPTPTSTVYRKVTATADITDGEYLIVYEGDATHDAAVFDGSLDNDNIDVAKKVLAVEIENGEIAGNTELDAAVFTIDVTAGSLQSASGLYIGRTNYDNGMDKSTTEAYVNTFAITDGAAVIKGAGNCTLRYNYAVDQLRFRYYKSGQQAIQLYKKETVTPPTPDYTRNVTNGNYGTICLPKAGTIEGAKLFEVAYFDGSMIYVDEILSGEMAAGVPYIFQATSTQLNVTYNDNTVEPVAAGDANGLYGFYNLSNMATDDADKLDLDEDQGNYILYQNQYWLVSGRAAYINNFRAYIKLGEISTTAPEPTPGQAPRRRVAMAVHGEQVATGMENVQGDNVQCTKVLIDGQLFILRGEKMYDVKGQLVK